MASKRESNFINMVVTLLIVSAVAALALGAVYTVTKEPSLRTEKVPVGDGGDTLILYVASKENQVVGTAIKTYTMKGFSGRIELMVGFLNDGSIDNTAVLMHKETPGLGDKMDMSKSDFSKQFNGKNPADFKLKVKKDGGAVDAITAATISSRAFCDAVQRAYDIFEKEGGKK